MRQGAPAVAIATAIAALALLTCFQFPGHTWIQQDSQIYVAKMGMNGEVALTQRSLLFDGEDHEKHRAFRPLGVSAEARF